LKTGGIFYQQSLFPELLIGQFFDLPSVFQFAFFFILQLHFCLLFISASSASAVPVAPCCTLPFQPGFFVILLSFLLWLI
jgi:hypothetical protein